MSVGGFYILKNPLTVIYGHAGLIAKGGQTEARAQRGARSISASVNQMLNIISDLLDITALETGQLPSFMRCHSFHGKSDGGRD